MKTLIYIEISADWRYISLTPSPWTTPIDLVHGPLEWATHGGRVEKTDPRSADYPLTPAPRTTLRTTPRTTLRTTPADYPKKSTKFLLRSTKIQKAYLLFLHDHNCMKNSRHLLFLHFSTQSFSFCPILPRPATCQNAVSTMDDR